MEQLNLQQNNKEDRGDFQAKVWSIPCLFCFLAVVRALKVFYISKLVLQSCFLEKCIKWQKIRSLFFYLDSPELKSNPTNCWWSLEGPRAHLFSSVLTGTGWESRQQILLTDCVPPLVQSAFSSYRTSTWWSCPTPSPRSSPSTPWWPSMWPSQSGLSWAMPRLRLLVS